MRKKGDDLTWGVVARASGVDEPAYDTRGKGKGKEPETSSRKQVEKGKGSKSKGKSVGGNTCKLIDEDEIEFEDLESRDEEEEFNKNDPQFSELVRRRRMMTLMMRKIRLMLLGALSPRRAPTHALRLEARGAPSAPWCALTTMPHSLKKLTLRGTMLSWEELKTKIASAEMPAGDLNGKRLKGNSAA
ncbi:hypothetical protein ACS0TY_004754 [Phlomoides rotata]